MYALLAVWALIIFSITSYEKPLFIAMLLLSYSMPAPFIIPLYADVTGHGEYISTTLSVQTLLSIALFIGIVRRISIRSVLRSPTQGVYKWTSDMNRMTCSYFDIRENALVQEVIPSA